MTKRIEIVPANGGLAVVETYLGGRRTGMSERLPVAKARSLGTAAAAGGEYVDHTRDGRTDEQAKRAATIARFKTESSRP